MVPRAIEILQTVDIIAAEDTRHSARLMQHFQITTPMMAYHDHSNEQKVQDLVARLRGGAKVALISDAGTPLVSDPGYRLVMLARKEGVQVIPIPGACAAIAALSASGLPSDRFTFAGFPPAKSGARQSFYQQFASTTHTLIFYESPHRIVESLVDMTEVFGPEREVVLAREITKTFETFLLGSVADVHAKVVTDTNQQKGEIVLLVKGLEKSEGAVELDEAAQKLMRVLLAESLSVKQASNIAAKITGIKKKVLYDWGSEQ
jgi:16S rRNA (cytidine1402-2'-O)-methyltransferase